MSDRAPMDTARVIQVIEVNILRRSDPTRMVRQYFFLDGELLTEVDDWAESSRRNEK